MHFWVKYYFQYLMIRFHKRLLLITYQRYYVFLQTFECLLIYTRFPFIYPLYLHLELNDYLTQGICNIDS